MSAEMMEQFAIFLDGFARAALFSVAPQLFYRLLYGISNPVPSLWCNLGFYVAAFLSLFILGRWLGAGVASRLSLGHAQRRHVYVARLGGVVLSLHTFVFLGGLHTIFSLLAFRFLTGFLAGMVYVASGSSQRKLHSAAYGQVQADSTSEYSQSARYYLQGATFSILYAGLFFEELIPSPFLRDSSGANLDFRDIGVLVAMIALSEALLRKLFSASSRVTRSVSFSHFTARQGRLVSPKSAKGILEDPHQSPLRARTSSQTSVGEESFYDCHSVFSDQQTAGGFRTPPLSPVPTLVSASASSSDTRVATYRDGQCVYDDGSHAFVPPGDSVAHIPDNYLKFYNNNEQKARTAWNNTQEWRREKQVHNVHRMPNKWFSEIKKAYPHFVHGYSKHGFPIVYEQPGKMNLKELFRNGCNISDMVRHYTFFTEFIANRISQKEEVKSLNESSACSSSTWGIMVVMDIQNAGVGMLSADVVRYLKEAGEINSKHYPLSMKRVFVVNVPFWFAGVWSTMKGILPESVHVDLLSKEKYRNALLDFIDEDQIPPEYGGTSSYRLGEHPFEIELKQLVDEANLCEDPGADDEEQAVVEATMPPFPVLVHSAETEDSDIERGNVAISGPVRRKMRDENAAHNPRSAHESSSLPVRHSEVFTVVSFILVVWNVIQGAIETAIPVWMLTPRSRGGIGLSSAWSGVICVCSCATLLGLSRLRSSRVVSSLPLKNPLRALRIGVGAEFFLLGFLSIQTLSRKLTFSATSLYSSIVLTCFAVANAFGKESCLRLHQLAARRFSQQPNVQQPFLWRHYSDGRFIADCESGKLSSDFATVFRALGAVVCGVLWSWSVSSGRQFPFDATFVFFVSCLIACVLYVASFSLYIDSVGEFAPHPKEKRNNSSFRRSVALFGEILVAAMRDWVCLLKEIRSDSDASADKALLEQVSAQMTDGATSLNKDF